MCRRPGHRRSSCQLPPRGPVAAATRAERCCHPPLNIKDAAVIGDGECWLPTAVVAGSYRLARWPSRPAGVFAQCVVGERIDRPPAHGAVAFVCARPVSRPRRCRRSTYTCTSTTPASTTSGPARPSPRARRSAPRPALPSSSRFALLVWPHWLAWGGRGERRRGRCSLHLRRRGQPRPATRHVRAT